VVDLVASLGNYAAVDEANVRKFHDLAAKTVDTGGEMKDCIARSTVYSERVAVMYRPHVPVPCTMSTCRRRQALASFYIP